MSLTLIPHGRSSIFTPDASISVVDDSGHIFSPSLSDLPLMMGHAEGYPHSQFHIHFARHGLEGHISIHGDLLHVEPSLRYGIGQPGSVVVFWQKDVQAPNAGKQMCGLRADGEDFNASSVAMREKEGHGF